MSAQAGVVRLRVEHIMGTAIVIDVRAPAPADDILDTAIDRAFGHLRVVDARFSTYKADSEVSRLNAGFLTDGSFSVELHEVLELCERARVLSDGYFDIRGHRGDGLIDPSGLVKGWAAERAAKILDEAGVANYCINAAGDMVARGAPQPDRPWRIGIRDPWDATAIAAIVAVSDSAVATSGAYERGNHVVVPRTHGAPDGIASMTVVGASLTWADTWATAAFAMGIRGVDWVARELDGYEACAVSSDRHLVMSAGFEALLVRD